MFVNQIGVPQTRFSPIGRGVPGQSAQPPSTHWMNEMMGMVMSMMAAFQQMQAGWGGFLGGPVESPIAPANVGAAGNAGDAGDAGNAGNAGNALGGLELPESLQGLLDGAGDGENANALPFNGPDFRTTQGR